MEWNGLSFDVKNTPALDGGFIPMMAALRAHNASTAKNGGVPVAIAVRRSAEAVSVYETMLHASGFEDADRLLMERIVKFLLWMKGGYEVTVYGADSIGQHIKQSYAKGGAREFDAEFMSRVYERPFSVKTAPYSEKIAENDRPVKIGGNEKGCRIGFDAGGSDRKVSAVIDGKAVFSNEVVWHPKLNEDPQYHYEGIMDSLKTAQSYLPRVDAIGVSSAGIYVDNRCMVASLFIKVPQDKFDAQAKDIYIRAAAEIGAPLTVANDGDVAALAGAMGMGRNNLLGIAMGTSEAAGFVDEAGLIKGWLNELAFAPVDLSTEAMKDEWSGDIGCGVKYFSQDGAIKLAGNGGIPLTAQTPAEKLKQIQELFLADREKALPIYESMGVYLGHSAALYHYFYGMTGVLLMGRIMSGEGGEVILSAARRVLAEEYPEYADAIELSLPDEKTRRVGQSVAAASL